MSDIHNPHVARWRVFEITLDAGNYRANPIQDAHLTAIFRSPSGIEHAIDGFWDGGRRWRIRFMPGEAGEWSYSTSCSDESDSGLHGAFGLFECTATDGASEFDHHGPVGVSSDGRYFAHSDGTPFFWLGDTAWNGPLQSRRRDWRHYLEVRSTQGYNVVQWVATQWRVAPLGDRHGRPAYMGRESIMVNPAFFRRLDRKIQTMNDAGFLSAIVMMWAHPGTAYKEMNPGHELPEDQAILLGRYMVARWGAYHVAWILAGDGNYDGENALRWHRIGEGVFGGRPHAPVAMHFQGKKLPLDDFRDQAWLDVMGYQSGHSGDDESLEWIFDGPVTRRWAEEPHKLLINLEPPYENHRNRGGPRFEAHEVRRACWWSMLNAPPSGLTYGGHGVWGWDDGVEPPFDHPYTGVALRWREALHLEAGTQVGYLREVFESVEWSALRPQSEMVITQPDAAAEHISAARTEDGQLAVVYSPGGGQLRLNVSGMGDGIAGEWINPRTGEGHEAVLAATRDGVVATPPGDGDWVLVILADGGEG